MKLANKVALVTGAGKGIGAGIALEFARQGADVIVNYASSAIEAGQVVEQIQALGRRALAVKANVAYWDQVHTMVDLGWQEFGKIDILVNNAGLTRFFDFFEITEAEWDETIDINLKGAFMCAQAVACKLRAAGLPGRFINIGSIHNLVTVPFVTPYAASKGGMDALTRQMALALAPYKISVNCIAPGLVEVQRIADDPLYEREERAKQIPWGRVGFPEDVARVCLLFASDDCDFTTGQVLYVDGGQGLKLAMRRGSYE